MSRRHLSGSASWVVTRRLGLDWLVAVMGSLVDNTSPWKIQYKCRSQRVENYFNGSTYKQISQTK